MAMKIVLISALLCVAAAEQVNPIQKVIQLISSLEGKLLKEGEAEEKAYKEFFEWCDDAAKNKQFEVKTAKAQKEKLEATIAEAESNAESAAASIEELSAQISTDQADLKAATEIREKENAEFAANEAELADAVDTLGRAIGIISREMKGSALIQAPMTMKNLNALMSTMSTLIDAASFSGQDMQELVALVQNKDKDGDDDGELGAPAPDAYKSHSGGIVDVLEDMKEKAEGKLSEARKAEMNNKHNFDMMKQSLTDAVAAAEHELNEAKASKSDAEHSKATAEGDLSMTVKDLADGEAALETVGTDCMSAASDHEVSVNGRKEELAALGKAKKIIQTTTAGAEGQTYSFMQISSSSATGSNLQTSTDLRNFEVVNAVKRVAREQHSTELAQLASRIAAVLRYGASSGEDPFAKVKGLITEMIDRLMKEAAEEASFKAYCDEEMAKTKQKKEELNTDISKLSAKIDQASSSSAGLKDDVQELQKELAALAASQSDMDKVRKDENAAFVAASADLKQGLDGVQAALKVLREYYGSDAALLQGGTTFDDFMHQPSKPAGHSKASGAGGGIIGMLEVIESDLAKNLAEIEAEEAAAQTQYDKVTQENKITTETKRQDVKYKTKEFTGLDKEVAELSADRDSANTELDAVLEYDTKIKAQCIAKPETYEERKKRREAEIAGLKEALSILEGQALFLQHGKRGLRGISAH
jgi:chromosome segregation ATPase